MKIKSFFVSLFILFSLTLSAIQDKYDIYNFDMKGVVDRRTVLGRLLYAIDLYGIKATEYISQKGIVQSDKRIRGWVVVLYDITKPRVVFYGFNGPVLQGLHEVTFNKDSMSYLDISKKPLNGIDLGMVKARETVLSQFKPLCDVKYNTALIEIKERIAVYMIPASPVPDKISLSGTQVFYTDKNGNNIVEFKTFFEKCISYDKLDKDGKKLSEIEIVLPEEKIPPEILVFEAVLHGVSFNVISSDKKKWKIEKGAIIQEAAGK